MDGPRVHSSKKFKRHKETTKDNKDFFWNPSIYIYYLSTQIFTNKINSETALLCMLNCLYFATQQKIIITPVIGLRALPLQVKGWGSGIISTLSPTKFLKAVGVMAIFTLPLRAPEGPRLQREFGRRSKGANFSRMKLSTASSPDGSSRAEPIVINRVVLRGVAINGRKYMGKWSYNL